MLFKGKGMDRSIKSKLMIDQETKKVIYLGYELDLTPDEYLLVCTMLDGNGRIEDSDFIQIISPSKTITLGNLAVHVCNINQKAMVVGGRKIIAKQNRHYVIENDI